MGPPDRGSNHLAKPWREEPGPFLAAAQIFGRGQRGSSSADELRSAVG